jgi:ADP-heptose:LPS heptosyltransferase
MTTEPRRIAVLRALPGVGDLLCAVPALRAIRDRHPGALVTLVGLESGRWFVERFPALVDELLVVQGVPGLPEVAPDSTLAWRFVGQAQERRFDLAFQLHGDGRMTNLLTTLLGARHQICPYRPGRWVPPGTAVPYLETGHEIDRLLAVVEAAGCPPRGRHLELPVSRAEDRLAERLTTPDCSSAREYACLNPGASTARRCWRPEAFAAVGRHLVARGLRLVVTGVTDDQPRVEAVMDSVGAVEPPVVDLTGRTDLGVLGAVFARARLVVTNDTGSAHVAAAVGAPSVVVTGSAEPARWAPLDANRHATVSGSPSRTWPAVSQVLAAIANLPPF